jgi:hypothetical protein
MMSLGFYRGFLPQPYEAHIDLLAAQRLQLRGGRADYANLQTNGQLRLLCTLSQPKQQKLCGERLLNSSMKCPGKARVTVAWK